jgi:hypothetical protein
MDTRATYKCGMRAESRSVGQTDDVLHTASLPWYGKPIALGKKKKRQSSLPADFFSKNKSPHTPKTHGARK